MDEYLDVKTVAQRLGVTERTVYNKVRSGDLPAYKVGRVWRVSPADLETWLEASRLQTHAGVAVEDGPLPSHTTLTAALSDIEDPLERRLTFVALLSDAVSALGWTPPVIVGGHAVEFYTAGGYATVDIDLAVASEPVDRTLAAWGFQRQGRHWYDGELGLVVEAPAAALDPGAADHVVEVEVSGRIARIIGVEDLIVDRMNACRRWPDDESCMWARVLVQGYRDRLDPHYLRSRADAEGVGDLLEDLLREVPS